MASRRCKSSYSLDVPVNGLTVKMTLGGTSSIALGIVPIDDVGDEGADEAGAICRAGAGTGATGPGVAGDRLFAGAGLGALVAGAGVDEGAGLDFPEIKALTSAGGLIWANAGAIIIRQASNGSVFKGVLLVKTNSGSFNH